MWPPTSGKQRALQTTGQSPISPRSSLANLPAHGPFRTCVRHLLARCLHLRDAVSRTDPGVEDSCLKQPITPKQTTAMNSSSTRRRSVTFTWLDMVHAGIFGVFLLLYGAVLIEFPQPAYNHVTPTRLAPLLAGSRTDLHLRALHRTGPPRPRLTTAALPTAKSLPAPRKASLFSDRPLQRPSGHRIPNGTDMVPWMPGSSIHRRHSPGFSASTRCQYRTEGARRSTAPVQSRPLVRPIAPGARSGVPTATRPPNFAPSTTNNNTSNTPYTMKTKRTRSIEPAVMTIGQVCLLLMMLVIVPF